MGTKEHRQAATVLSKANEVPGLQNAAATELAGAVEALQREVAERERAERLLQDLCEEEKRLRQQLEEEMNRRAEFTRILAHELKTPLTPLISSSQVLAAELRKGPLLSLAQNVCRGAFNLNSKVDELIDLARGEIGILRLDVEPVDMCELLAETLDDVTCLAASRGQSLVSELPESLPPLMADPARLRQVVLNLLNNAMKFTPTGGAVSLRAWQDRSNVIIEVQDTGVGIPDDEQGRVFEPYRQLGCDGQRASGLGLGLALCKTLVHLHEGRVWVRSRMGEGSTFGFSLPLEPSEAVAPIP